MAFPPVPQVPSGVRENTTPQVNLHPQDHTLIHQALTDIINELGPNPSGDAPSVTALFSMLCPVGEIKMYGGSSAPSGWALCNGDAVSRVTYADLFAAIDVWYGVGDGSSTFNLPDMRGRSPLGVDSNTSYATRLGLKGGDPHQYMINHVHTMTPVGVDHRHTFDDQATTDNPGNHDHNIGNGSQLWWFSFDGPTGGVYGPASGTGLNQSGLYTAQGGHTHKISGVTGGSDRGLSHEHEIKGPVGTTVEGGVTRNLHPYTTVNYIIRMT